MSDQLNNFEQLLEEQSEAFDARRHRQAKEKVLDTLGSYKLIGQLVTVYVPTMFNVLIAASGGEQPAPNEPPPGGHPPNLGPGPAGRGPQLPEDGEDLIR